MIVETAIEIESVSGAAIVVGQDRPAIEAQDPHDVMQR